MASYKDYAPNPEDNSGSVPRGLPQSYKGDALRSVIRHLMAAVRNLGDGAAKVLPADAERTLGSAAFASVEELRPQVGLVPVGAILPFHGTLSQAEAQRPFGFLVCDGRTVQPFNDAGGVCRGPYTMPDLRYYYLRFWYVGQGMGGSYNIQPMSELIKNELQQPTTLAGAHDHGGQTFGHALTTAELPVNLSTRTVDSGTNAVVAQLAGQSAAAHAHGIEGTGDHGHFVDITNPYVAVIPLKRMF